MKNDQNFIDDLRQESQRPAPVSRSDPWKEMTGTDAVVQRGITAPMSDGSTTREISLAAILADPNQPRRTMDAKALHGLAESIQQNGVLEPITVTWSDAQRAYLIVTGHRRYEAAKLAGLDSIPARIHPVSYDERQRLQQQLVENIQREGIPPVEEARAIDQLMDAFELSQRAVAKRLGKPQTYVAELLQILRIPSVLLERGKDLPKHSLLEISKSRGIDEQSALLDMALKSPTPFKAVAAERMRRNPKARVVQFKRTFTTAGLPGSVTVTVEKHPEDVTAEYIVQLLEQVSRSLGDGGFRGQ